MKRLILSLLHYLNPHHGRLLSKTFVKRIYKVTSLIIISILGLKLSNVTTPSISSSSLNGPLPEGSLYPRSLEVGESIGLQQHYLPQLEAIRHGRLVPPDQVGFFN